MSSVYQRLMADGQWELNLKPDTPRAILDKLVPFNVHLVVTPSEIDIGSSDAVFLAAARYVGPMRKVGANRLNPGGPGNSMWLGDPDGKGEIIYNAVTSATGTLSSWVTNLLPTSLTSGTVTSPGGTFSNAYQWVSRRAALNSVARAFGVEWRVNNDFTFDAGTVGTLYRSVADGDTPAVTVARGFGGRDPQVVGIRSAIETEIDWLDYVSNVVVLGDGTSEYPGGSGVFRKPTGPLIDWALVVQDPTAPASALTDVAQSVYDTLPHAAAGRREVKVQTDVYDPAGDVVLGDDVYVWDPENGLVDTANQVTFQGQLVYPAVMRCVGMKWPIRRGMGVFLRIQNDTFNPTYENITNYVEFGTGSADIELSTASRPLRVDQYGNLVEARGPALATPWLTYTPAITGTGTAVGNGTVLGAYRRDGSTLHLRVTWTLGSTSTVGTGGVTFSLPSGATAVTQTNTNQMCHAMYNDTGTIVYEGHAYVGSAGTTLQCNVWNVAGTYPTWTALAAAVPHTWANTDFINVNGTLEVAP